MGHEVKLQSMIYKWARVKPECQRLVEILRLRILVITSIGSMTLWF